jgi:hypothetical protein
MGLPIYPMSIHKFCFVAKALLTEGRHEDFVKMVLNGTYDGNKIVVNAILDAMDDSEHFAGTRDYDSLLGISENICVKAPLTVNPIAKHNDTLRTSVHLKHGFNMTQVSLYLLNIEAS